MNPLKKLEALGQSIWLDYIRRDLITSGRLKKMIEEDGLRGMTSNPAIFDKAITESHDYDDLIQQLAGKKNLHEIYDALTIRDIQDAADTFRPVYNKTDGHDGYVSLEVNPHLAHDTHGTVEEARRLWKEVNRPNVFIKVPATAEGLPAISTLIGEGINVNVTLLFGLPRYKEVALAYMTGLETLASKGKPLEHVASVASFFLSRIDVLLDPILEKKGAKELVGEVAIASAKLAYPIYKEVFSSERFKKLEAKGAQPQRLLWASTSTKNPAYSDVKYIEPLIGPNTVNTVPLETFDAYKDHGKPELRLEKDVDKAKAIFEKLKQAGIDINQVTQQLIDEGVEKFNKPFDHLMETLEKVTKGQK